MFKKNIIKFEQVLLDILANARVTFNGGRKGTYFALQ